MQFKCTKFFQSLFALVWHLQIIAINGERKSEHSHSQ